MQAASMEGLGCRQHLQEDQHQLTLLKSAPGPVFRMEDLGCGGTGWEAKNSPMAGEVVRKNTALALGPAGRLSQTWGYAGNCTELWCTSLT